MRPHDIVILLKIVSKGAVSWFNKDLAQELFISSSEVSESLHRSMIAGLIDPSKKIVFVNALMDFLEHGLKYVFPVQPGAIVKGVPTAHSASVLNDIFKSDEIFVWPDPEGKSRGQEIEPLYPTISKAVSIDKKLYNLLALCDVLRIGRVREKKVAIEKLAEIIKNK